MRFRAIALMGGAFACLGFGGSAVPAAAQAPAPLAVDATTQVYDQAFFRQYTLSNAEDMLRRIPGVAAVLDSSSTSQARGLGAGTEQVLIDGKRMTGKSNNVAAALRRIPAASVERVELIRGSSDQVQSEGLVVNVVLKAGASLGGVGNFELTYRFDDRGWSDADGLVSYANNLGRLSYVLGYEKQAWSPLGLGPNQGGNDWSVRFRDERYFHPTGELMELRPQKWRRELQRHVFTANTTYALAGEDALRLNVLYAPNPVKQVDVTSLTRFATDGTATGRATEQHYNKVSTDVLELGGELELGLGPGGLTVTALHSRTGIGSLDFRDRTEATGAFVELGRSANDQHKGEDVVRAAYDWTALPGHTVSLGVEGARNFLTQNIEVFFDLDRDGRLERIDIPTAFARVAEKRAELFLTDSWRVRPDWTVDGALFFEISRITTNYPAIPVRTLKYLKPRVDIRYTPTSRDRIRFKVERTVSQLDFANFVPTYNVVDLRIDLGNPMILPMRTWLYELSYEHRLPGDNGTLGLRLFNRDSVGGINFVPFGFNSAGLPISARGNSPPSNFRGFEANAAVRLAILGLPNAQVNARVLRTASKATDAFTGRERKAVSNWDWETTLGFRHDVATWKASYGFDYFATTGVQLVTDVRNYEEFGRGDRLNLFVEKALWGPYSLRFDAYSVNGADEVRRRSLYRISQSDGALSRTERYDETRDRRFAVRLRGKF